MFCLPGLLGFAHPVAMLGLLSTLQESPVLGAWGLGWEVWCDGQEITQFTYFQQAGGKSLDYPAIEITYGLERILMALQVWCYCIVIMQLAASTCRDGDGRSVVRPFQL